MSQWLKINKVYATNKYFTPTKTLNTIAINKNSIGTIMINGKSYTYNEHLKTSVTDINKVINPSLKTKIYIRKT